MFGNGTSANQGRPPNARKTGKAIKTKTGTKIKRKRRTINTGTIMFRKDRQKWHARLPTWVPGRPSLVPNGFDTKEEASDALARYMGIVRVRDGVSGKAVYICNGSRMYCTRKSRVVYECECPLYSVYVCVCVCACGSLCASRLFA